MPNLLSTAQVAERLGLSRRAVIGRVERGKLTPAMQLPGRTGSLLFDAEEIDALAAERDADPDPTQPQKISDDRSVA